MFTTTKRFKGVPIETLVMISQRAYALCDVFVDVNVFQDILKYIAK